MALGESVETGAGDWRSVEEKEKSLMRKACASLFKCWIPDHPEARQEKSDLHRNFRIAMGEFHDSVTLVSQLSTGVEDILAHGYHAVPLSMQELLVQREGSDAFLDAKMALRVVRRKFGMMTLVSRMASTLEQRNTIAITIRNGISEADLVNFSKIV